jgi:hypothetical protein
MGNNAAATSEASMPRLAALYQKQRVIAVKGPDDISSAAAD